MTFPLSLFRTRFVRESTTLLVLVLAGGGLLLSACTSRSAPEEAPDSTAVGTVSQRPPPNPSAPTTVERERDDRSLAEKLSDTSVEAKVKRALLRASGLRLVPFRPTVVDGHLILRGDVNTPDQYHRAARIAEQVEGVTALTNRLTMDGRPVTDDRLANEDESEASSGTEEAMYHTVQRGDTLWSIARKYRASVRQIRSLNELRTNNLTPGRRLRVR